MADFLEVGLGNAAAADGTRGDAGLLGENTGGELFSRHFAGEEADNAAIDRLHGAVSLDFGAMRLGDIVGDVGGERGLAHAGTAGDDDQVGWLQAAHLGVEIAQPGRDPGQLAVALKGLCRHIDGNREGLRKALEPAVVAAGLGQLVQPALGILDLRPRRKIHRRVEGDIDHVLADPDQVATQRQFVDGAAVILGIDDGGGFRGEAGEVLADRHAADVGFGRHEGLQRDRGCDLAHPDQAAGGLEDGLMDRLEEVLRLQKVRHPIERVVVDQDRAQQALLRLDIVRCAPIGRGCRVGSELEDVRIKRGHGSRVFVELCRMRGGDKAPPAARSESRNMPYARFTQSGL